MIKCMWVAEKEMVEKRLEKIERWKNRIRNEYKKRK
jgi:hypothetical protein